MIPNIPPSQDEALLRLATASDADATRTRLEQINKVTKEMNASVEAARAQEVEATAKHKQAEEHLKQLSISIEQARADHAKETQEALDKIDRERKLAEAKTAEASKAEAQAHATVAEANKKKQEAATKIAELDTKQKALDDRETLLKQREHAVAKDEEDYNYRTRQLKSLLG